MSSLLNKLKGHGGDKHHSTAADDSYNHPTSNTGYDNTNTAGYGNTSSPTHRNDAGYGNSPITSGGNDSNRLSSHSDGGRYHAPKGTALGQSHNTQTVGPHNNDTMNRLDPRVDSDQSRLRQNQGYGDSNYGQSGYNTNSQYGAGNTTLGPHSSNLANKADPRVDSDNSGNQYGGVGNTNTQAGYGSTTQGPHSSNLANKADPRVDSDRSRTHHGIGTTTTTTTNTSTSVGTSYGTHDGNKRLPADPNHPTLLEKANPKVDTDSSRRQGEYGSAGYGNTTGSNQYGSTAQDATKRLPQDPNHPTLMEKANPNVDTDTARRHDGLGTTGAGYGTTAGSHQYGSTTHDPSKRLPEDPNHPTLMEKANPKVDTDNSRRNDGFGTTGAGYGNTTGSNQYGSTTHDSNKRLPDDPNHPTLTEKANPNVLTDSTRRHEQDNTYGTSGYGSTSGTQYDNTRDTTKRLPEDPNHPTLMEKLNPKVDTDSSRRGEYDTTGTNTGYGTTSSTTAGPHNSNLANRADPRVDSDLSSSRHNQHGGLAAAGATGAAAGYGASTESSRHHHAHPVRNDDSTMMNRSHPHTSMHPSDRRYDADRADQQVGPDGEYLPGPASKTAGPHKSDALNKLDPRVDSDQSKLEKEREREREGYGNDSTRHHGTTGVGGATYGSEHERRLNEGNTNTTHHDRDRRHDGGVAGIGSTGGGYGRDNDFSNRDRDRDSGYGGTNVSSNLPSHHRKAVGDNRNSGAYGNDRYNDPSSTQAQGGAFGSTNTAGGVGGIGSNSGYGNTNTNTSSHNPLSSSNRNNNNLDEEPDKFECAKCGHTNSHLLRRNRHQQQQQQRGYDNDDNNNTSTFGSSGDRDAQGNKIDEHGNVKPSLMERLNPKVDSTGDGKAGFLK